MFANLIFIIANEKTSLISNEKLQKQPSRSVLRKRCSENMQQIYRRTPMPCGSLQSKKGIPPRTKSYRKFYIVSEWYCEKYIYLVFNRDYCFIFVSLREIITNDATDIINATVILLQDAEKVYYKLRQAFLTKCDCLIKRCDSY